MTPRAVFVVHREALAAEGIAAALARFPALVPVGASTSVAEVESADGVDVVAIDERAPGAVATAGRLRRRGIRVVMVGEAADDDEGVRVPRSAPVAVLASALVPGAKEAGGTARLSRREREILALAARGMAGKQIARQLGISPKTVEQHKTRMYRKLGVANQTAAVAVIGALEGGSPWTRSST